MTTASLTCQARLAEAAAEASALDKLAAEQRAAAVAAGTPVDDAIVDTAQLSVLRHCGERQLRIWGTLCNG